MDNHTEYGLLLTTRKPRYANTPFEVDEYDETETGFDCARSERSGITLGSMDTFASGKSYLILDFEEGELSPCDTEFGYGITHPQEVAGDASSQSKHTVSSSESIWYDEEDEEEDDSDSDLGVDDGSISINTSLPSMSHSSSGEDTDGAQTPISEEKREEDEDEDAAIDELRASLKRHLPPSSSGSEYFEMLVADALSSLDQALRETPVDCFEEMCWESCPLTPLASQSFKNRSSLSRRTSKQYTPANNLIDVPEEVPATFDWEWNPNVEGYKYTIPSPSQNIGFSPQQIIKTRERHSSTRFQRLARHLRLGRDPL